MDAALDAEMEEGGFGGGEESNEEEEEDEEEGGGGVSLFAMRPQDLKRPPTLAYAPAPRGATVCDASVRARAPRCDGVRRLLTPRVRRPQGGAAKKKARGGGQQASKRGGSGSGSESDGGAGGAGSAAGGGAARTPVTTADPLSFSKVDPRCPAKVRGPARGEAGGQGQGPARAALQQQVLCTGNARTYNASNDNTFTSNDNFE